MNEAPIRRNVKISARSWEILRWAKYKLNKRNYSECIIEMSKKITISMEDPKFKSDLAKNFDANKHKIYVKEKVPIDDPDPVNSKKPKTILLHIEAINILKKIRASSDVTGYSYGDIIEYLSKKNDLIPKNLQTS